MPHTSPRMLHVDRRTLQNAVRNILDGELLNRYLYLSTMERSELAKKIGTTPDIVREPPTSPPHPTAPCPVPHLPSPHRSWMICWRQTGSLPTSRPLDTATATTPFCTKHGKKVWF